MVRSPVSLQLRLTPYERLSIGLTSVLLLLGAVTLLLFILWFSRSAFVDRHPAQVSFAGVALPGPQVATAAGGELPIPSDDELPGIENRPPETTPESIAEIVQSQIVKLSALSSDDAMDGSIGRPKGQLRDRAGQDSFSPTIDPGSRWEIRFSATTLEEYKRQLDHFGIELGIAGGGISTVDYVKDFTAEVPTTRLRQDPKQEKRVRFLYRIGPLKEADRQLARAAGIDVEGRIVFQFHNAEMYNALLKLEIEKLKSGVRVEDVVRTIFAVRRTAGGYEFYVVRQDYRAVGIAPLPIRPT